MEIIEYTVRPGNTLFGIAQFFQTTISDILRYNNIASPDSIYTGQTLQIPAGTLMPPTSHVVRPGETLWSISRIYNTTIEELSNKNGLINPNILYPGQILRI